MWVSADGSGAGAGRAPLDPRLKSSAAREFEDDLRSRIVGQEDALEKVASLYQVYLAGFHPSGRPIGNLLFLGPTGTGKTRVVEAVAESLYGDARAMIKVDCAEFQHSHEIAKLIGSPPGYLGHRETHPILTQEALNQWHTDKCKISLVLFDEIEKASDSLWQLLLGVLDKASLTLGDNRRVDMSNCLIFMTSNLGAAEIGGLVDGGIGFTPQALGRQLERMDQRVENTALEAARRRFSPEFLNRIDQMVVFRQLSEPQLRSILDMELMKVQDRVLGVGREAFLFHLTPLAKDFLLTEGIDRRYGARHLKRAIERHLVQPLANLVASGQVIQGDSIAVDVSVDGPGMSMSFMREEGAAVIPPPSETRQAPVVMAASMSAAKGRLGRKADLK